MLRKIRLTLAIIFFTLITLLFLDITGALHTWLGWMAKVQLLPAILAVNVCVLVFLVVLTLLLGRVYCSVICPLGVFQDGVAWLRRLLSSKKNRKRYRFSSANDTWRYSIFGIVIIAILAHLPVVTSLLDPYAAYGRMVSNLLASFYRWGNNFFAYLAERSDSYAFYSAEVWLPSLITLLIALITLFVVSILAWRGGRTYCNSVCPVGTLLGLLSRVSLFRPTIDGSRCNQCMQCARLCKSSCIDVKAGKVDYSRCVACMNCIGMCKQDAMHYSLRLPHGKKSVGQESNSTDFDAGRRAFFTAGTLFAGATLLQAQEKKRDGGFAIIEEKVTPPRLLAPVPPGAQGIRPFAHRCTACQLCVSSCPTRVLRPSTHLASLMQPVMSFHDGYCRPECTRCSEVCPTGAIRLISKDDKKEIQIGHAVWIRDNCVPLRDEKPCGNCARHCPQEAITMVPSDPDNPKSIQIPAIDTERCIGCGACEYLCPSRPLGAIYVEGHEVHRAI
jgi:ferredoxin